MIASDFSPFSPAPHLGLLPMVVFGAMVLALMAALLVMIAWLGRRRADGVKHSPYESGIPPTGNARFPYPAPFYLVAIFFLVFDVEAAYLFSWAIAFDRLGVKGWLEICFFILILLASLLYLWLKGGLDWEAGSPRQ